MKTQSRRRIYFVDPSFQFKFIMKFCVVVLGSSIVIGTVLFFLWQNSTTVAIENTRVWLKPTSDFLLPQMAAVLLIVTVFSCLVAMILTLLISHKISGPIYRIRQEIEQVRQGDLTRQFHIRDSDQMQELARSLAEMTRSLRERHLKIGGQCRSVSNFLEEKNLGGSQDDRDKLLKMIKEFYEMLSYFKV